MPISPLLQRFVDDELERSGGLIEQIAAGTLERLREGMSGGRAGLAQRQQQHEIADLLAQRAALFCNTFLDSLRRSVQADLQEQAGLPGDEPLGDSAGSLTLMDESRVEADIEISRAVQMLDTAAEWELRELQTFTSTLVGQAHVTAGSNPLRPLFYARALWEAASALSSTFSHRSLLLRVASGVAGEQLKRSWAAATSRLEAQGVQPGVYRTVVLGPHTASDRPPPLTLPASARPAGAGPAGARLEQLMAGLPQAAPAHPGGTDASRLEQALTQLDALLDQLPAVPLPVAGGGRPGAAVTPRLRDHQSALVSSATSPVDRQIIELLSRLFDLVLSDARLPGAFRALVARLQASALRVALHDASMMRSHDHPVWRLMDRIGESSSLYTLPGDPRLAALLAFCESLVQQMARAPSPDAALYRQALGQLEAHLQSQREAQLAQAQGKADELALAERLDHLQRETGRILSERMAGVQLQAGAVIRRFVTVGWARVLATLALRHGEQAEETLAGWRVVDDLLWSLQPPDHPQSRQRLVGLLPGLLQRLQDGMALVELPGAERQQLLDALMAVHTEALRPKEARASDANASAEDIVRRLREEDDSLPRPDALPFADSLIDVASMDTVPAELMDSAAAAPAAPAAAGLVDALRPGDGRRLFLRGRWTRAQLLWRSAGGQYFLFAGESPGRTHAVTQAALQRLDAEKLLLPLEEQPLTQRAVQALMHELDLPVA